MFDFLKKKKKDMPPSSLDQEKEADTPITIASGLTTTESAQISTQAAAQKFAKPTRYDRSVLDDSAAKRNIKTAAFRSGMTIKDPYTGDVLTLTKAEAKTKYGDNWTKHLAEADHKISLKKRYEQTKENPWLTNDDIKNSSNSTDNLEVVSRKFNNAKRSRSNEEFVTDDEYLNKTGVSLSKAGKEQAIKSEKISQKILKRKDLSDSARNIVQTGHNAGITAAKSAGTMGLTMSGIMNITAVIRGEKSAEDAVTDTIVSAGKSAATGYVMGGGLTTISHTLSGSSSKFLRALSESNVPGKVITTVMVMGDTLKRYANGEITTQECMIELGEKGLNLATAGYSMAVGQALIPIPVVGAAVGALVGSMITSSYYRQLITTLQTKELEHQERLRIIAECEEASRQARLFRQELENYLSSYFKDYQDCFDEAIALLQTSFQTGDTNGIIEGANQITKKLGGKVYYNNMDEFEEYLFDDSTDLL